MIFIVDIGGGAFGCAAAGRASWHLPVTTMALLTASPLTPLAGSLLEVNAPGEDSLFVAFVAIAAPEVVLMLSVATSSVDVAEGFSSTCMSSSAGSVFTVISFISFASPSLLAKASVTIFTGSSDGATVLASLTLTSDSVTVAAVVLSVFIFQLWLYGGYHYVDFGERERKPQPLHAPCRKPQGIAVCHRNEWMLAIALSK